MINWAARKSSESLTFRTISPCQIKELSKSDIEHLIGTLRQSNQEDGLDVDPCDQYRMSAIPRLAARTRYISTSSTGASSSRAASAPILKRQSILSAQSCGIVPSRRSARSSLLQTSTGVIESSRRYASTAAKTVEDEEQSEEQKWPVRILPELSEADTTRLKRQRNVGM